MSNERKYSANFLKKVKKRFTETSEEKTNIFWICLEDLCPQNCCSKNFHDEKVRGLFGIVETDVLPLLSEEKTAIIQKKGQGFIIQYSWDKPFYLNLEKEKDCPFLKKRKCGIQEIKPSLCRAYPLISLGLSTGPIFDYSFCPGFKVAEKMERKMTNREYCTMLEGFLKLQQYWINRMKWGLNKKI